MQMSDDPKVHSIFIGQLLNTSEMLRERTHKIDNEVKVQGSSIHKIDENLDETVKNVMGVIENQIKMKVILSTMSSDISSMKTYEEKRKKSIDFIKELFEKKKNWMLVFGVILFMKAFETINVTSIISALTRIL